MTNHSNTVPVAETNTDNKTCNCLDLIALQLEQNYEAKVNLLDVYEVTINEQSVFIPGRLKYETQGKKKGYGFVDYIFCPFCGDMYGRKEVEPIVEKEHAKMEEEFKQANPVLPETHALLHQLPIAWITDNQHPNMIGKITRNGTQVITLKKQEDGIKVYFFTSYADLQSNSFENSWLYPLNEETLEYIKEYGK